MEEFRIISTNIRFDNPKDGDHRWPLRAGPLAQALLDFGPSLIGTQEGRRPQLQELEKRLEGLELVDGHRQWIEERMYPCLYAHKDRVAIEQSGDLWLSETPHLPGSVSFGSLFPRLATWAVGTTRPHGMRFLAINLHLDHSHASVRSQQIDVLIAWLAKHRPASDLTCLMGDFNEGPQGEVQRKLLASHPHWKDAWKERNPSRELHSHHNFGTPASYADRIDWILYDGPCDVTHASFDQSAPGGVYLSDHYPLRASLCYRGAQANEGF